MLSVAGATQPLTYVWTPNVSTGPSASGLSAGTYQVAVTEAVTGCETFATVVIPEPAPVVLDVLEGGTSARAAEFDLSMQLL